MMSKMKDIFVEGEITAAFVADSLAAHQSKTGIGGHSIFIGQVRADELNGKTVQAIQYTAYREMALEKMHAIREDIFQKYPLICMHVHHSLGTVKTGSMCLFVFTSSAHRKPAIDACNEIVERLKAELPIWGKQLFEDESFDWKINT